MSSPVAGLAGIAVGSSNAQALEDSEPLLISLPAARSSGRGAVSTLSTGRVMKKTVSVYADNVFVPLWHAAKLNIHGAKGAAWTPALMRLSSKPGLTDRCPGPDASPIS